MSDKVTPEDDAMRAKHGVPVHTPPIHTDQPSVHDLLIDMIQRRKDFGKEKYGTELQAGNGRDALADMLDEVIDLAVYTVKEIEERKLERSALERVKARIEKSLYDLGVHAAGRRLDERQHGFHTGLGIALDYINTEIHGWKK